MARATVVALSVPILGACVSATDPATLMQLPPDAPARKAMQTRWFETSNEAELLSASAAALQDLGFQVSEISRELGFLRAAKERSAREYGQEIARVLVAFVSSLGLISGSNTLVLLPVDLQQQIHAALVTRPLGRDTSRHEARIVFFRLVWKGSGSSGNTQIPPGQQRMEMIRDAEIYRQFFARLSKAVFLEAHRI